MQIFHIITGLSDGGAEAVLYRLCTNDTLNQHTTVVSLMGAGKYGPLLEEAGVRVVCLDMPRGRVTLGGLWRLWRTIRRERPAVVQTWMYHADLIGGVVARLAGVRRVFWGIRHSDLVPGESSRSTIAVAKLCAWLSRFVPTGIACCAERARSVHMALGYVAHKFKVISNGYDISQLKPDIEARQHLRDQWSVPGDTPLLGMVARFDPQKDHANLLASLAALKTQGWVFRCVLVGSEMETDNAILSKWINEYDLQEEISLLGQRSDIPAVMSALDVHVLSSAFGEAFPNVLAEAMACDTPCVTTDVGDASLIVGETGWVVPPRDSQALASALASALEEYSDAPQDWTARQREARERIVGQFSITAMVERYRELWAGEALNIRSET